MHDTKDLIKAEILKHLQSNMQVMETAAMEAREAATHEESKAEDKYDTRGLEASYLAGAQAKRAAELKQLIKLYSDLPVRKFSSKTPIASTALVEVEYNNKKINLFMVPTGGGIIVEVNGGQVQVVSPDSILGSELLGKRQGDEFEVEIAGQVRSYCVLSVI